MKNVVTWHPSSLGIKRVKQLNQYKLSIQPTNPNQLAVPSLNINLVIKDCSWILLCVYLYIVRLTQVNDALVSYRLTTYITNLGKKMVLIILVTKELVSVIQLVTFSSPQPIGWGLLRLTVLSVCLIQPLSESQIREVWSEL